MNKLLTSLLLSAIFISNSNAQTATQNARVDAKGSEVRINQIDTSAFPKVTIFATVLKDGTPVEGLVATDFRVREDEVDQEPLTVVPQLSALNAVVTIDTSGSIKKALPQVQTAATNFLDSLDASDKFDVISFSREVKTISSDGNKAQAKQAIGQTVARGDTALFDAIYNSIAALKDRKGRKAVILLTDGVDDDGTGKQLSKHTIDEALELSKTVNAPVFAIGLGEQKDVATLEKIATGTGGKYFDAITPEQLADIYKQIGKEITGQYNIYYTSNLPADGSMHRVNLSYSGIQGIKEYESPKLASTTVTTTQSSSVPAVVETKQAVVRTSKEISSKAGLHVAVTLSEGTEAVSFDKVTVETKPATAFEEAKAVNDCYNQKSHCSFVVPTGSYRISARKGEARASVDVDVKAEQANNVWVNLNAGMVSVVAIPSDGASPTDMSSVYFNSKPASAFDEGKRVADCYNKQLCEVFIPAGSYEIVAKKGSAIAKQEAVVEPARKHEIQMNLKAGILNVVASASAGSELVQMKSVYVDQKAASAFDKAERADDCYSKDKCSFILNEGAYTVTVRYGDATVTEDVQIGLGQKVDKAFIMESGLVKIVMFDATGAKVKIKKSVIYRQPNNQIDKPERINDCYEQDICEFKLPSGKYKVEAGYGEVQKDTEFEVKSGQILNLEIR